MTTRAPPLQTLLAKFATSSKHCVNEQPRDVCSMPAHIAAPLHTQRVRSAQQTRMSRPIHSCARCAGAGKLRLHHLVELGLLSSGRTRCEIVELVRVGVDVIPVRCGKRRGFAKAISAMPSPPSHAMAKVQRAIVCTAAISTRVDKVIATNH